MQTYVVEIGASIDEYDMDILVLQVAASDLHASTLAVQKAMERWPQGQLHSARSLGALSS